MIEGPEEFDYENQSEQNLEQNSQNQPTNNKLQKQILIGTNIFLFFLTVFFFENTCRAEDRSNTKDHENHTNHNTNTNTNTTKDHTNCNLFLIINFCVFFICFVYVIVKK